jgi:HPt (histidine-containing phosphotransfer) domain-containing protein
MAGEKLYDLSILNRISGGDQSFILEMINTFRETAPEYLEKAHQLLEKDAIDSLSRETHRFIPGVSFLGAKDLEYELMKLEEYTKKHENLDQVPELLSVISGKIDDLIACFIRDFE